MKYSNINITSDKYNLNYIIEYNDADYFKNITDEVSYNVSDRSCNFINPNNVNVINDKNDWYEFSDETKTDYIPTKSDMSIVTLYFPNQSVETYVNNTKYILEILTYCNGVSIKLGSYVISRNDSVAADKVRKFLNTDYYECQSFEIIDPYYMLYSDEWKEFRSKICNEPDHINNTGAVLNFKLYPVKLTNGTYIKIDEFNGGQTGLSIDKSENDFLNCVISIKDGQDIQDIKNLLNIKFNYNPNYDESTEGFIEYLNETYNIPDAYHEDINIKIEFALKDNTDLYDYKEQTLPIFNTNDFDWVNMSNWDMFKPGLVFYVIATIMQGEDPVFELTSNEIIITQDVYSKLIKDEQTPIIDFDGLIYELKNNENIMNYDLNVVNKVVKNVIEVEKPDSYKANIIKPIFFRAHSTSNITIHPEITENISINLDAYKSKVTTFKIKVENQIFTEIGRTGAGIIFKIVGNKLDKEVTDGIYYILNEDEELVTSGKYVYEQ